MFILKKSCIILSFLLLISIIFTFFLHRNIERKDNFYLNTPASAEQINKTEEVILLLEKAKSSEERKKILKDNKEIINKEFVVLLLVKGKEAQDGQNLSLKKNQELVQIAIEVSEFLGDKVSLAKSLLHNVIFEIIDKKNENPPSLQKALKLFIEERDKKGEGVCYFSLARNLHFSFGKTDRAIELLNKSIFLFKEVDDMLLVGDCYVLIGNIYQDINNKDKAMENFNKGLEIFKEQGDIASILYLYTDMVYTCQFSGFLEEAEKYMEMKRVLIEELDISKLKDYSEKDEAYRFRDTELDSKEQLWVDYYLSHASLYSSAGKYEQSVKNYKNAIDMTGKMKEVSMSGMMAYWFLGNIYESIGQRNMALKYYNEAISKNNDKIPVYQVVLNYMNLGHFYLKDNPEESIKYYKIAIEENKKIQIDVFKEQYEALCIRCIGQAYEKKGEYDIALKELEKSLEIFEKIYKSTGQYDYFIVWNYELIGKVYHKKGDNKKALHYLNEALSYAVKSGKPYTMSNIYKELSNFYFEIEKYPQSLDFCLKGLDIAKEIRFPDELWNYYYLLGQIYDRQNNHKDSYISYSKSIEIIESMRQEFKIEEFKRDFMQDKIKVYEHMIDLLIKMKKIREAFNYNEKSRARAFMDILANQKVDIQKGIKPELKLKEEELSNRIQYLSSNIREEKQKPLIAQRSVFINETNNELKSLKLEYEQTLQQIKLDNPEYLSIISVNPLTLKEIQSLLDKDTAIVEYFLADEKSYVWIIDNKTINTFVLNCNRKEIEDLVKSYREKACDNMTGEKLAGNDWREISGKLYNILFKDVETAVNGKTRLIISPHRILHYLPFQVLIDNKGKLLIEKYDIVYLPSASILKYCKSKNTLKKTGLLAFELGNLKIGELPSLPGTDEEVKSIADCFSHKEIYSGKDMKTDILYNKGKDFDILHFATHGVMDASSPMFSSLIFADKRLNTYEIFGLNLNAYLVCLSACKTGIGEEANGDELVGLSRAFIYAGTPTICSSLWDVSDVATSELMKKFYENLKNNDKGRALKLAQLEIMKKYRHPFFWAPFVLTGDWR